MGGAIVTRFMRKSKLRDRVAALVLDAPALDWDSIISNQAKERHVGFLAKPVERTVEWRADLSLSELDEVKHAADFRGVPILLFQGLEDLLVPPEDTTAFAKKLPENVEYPQVPEAGHVESWNVNPADYERRLADFLQSVLGSSR